MALIQPPKKEIPTPAEYFKGSDKPQQTNGIPTKCYIEYPHREPSRIETICHAFLNRGEYRGMTGIWNVLWYFHQISRDKALAWWRYCLDEQASPWRSLFTSKDGRKLRILGDYEAYFIPIDETTPSQFAVSLMIATRLPHEYVGQVETFCMLLDQGFTAHEACYFASGLTFKGDKFERPYIGGHHAFDPTRHNFRLSDLIAGTPPGLNKGFTIQAGHGYRGLNAMWHHAQAKSLYQIAFPDDDDVYTGVFKRAFDYEHAGNRFGKGTGIPRDPNVVIESLKKARQQL